jgi:signal transduction histidine kinase
MFSVFRSPSLASKVILITSLVLIIAISFIAWWEIRIHEDSIKRQTYEKTKIISEFIEKNVISAMERDRHFEIHRILKNFTYRGIWKIDVFKPDGTIMASTRDDELNNKVPDVEFFLKNQYFIRDEVSQNSEGTIERERIYYFNSTILNKPACSRCHPAYEKIIGVLTVANSLKDMDQEIFRVKVDAVILSILTIVSLSLVLGLLFLKFVETPITKLTNTMRQVEEGNLNARAEITGKNEMGRLAENLNTMIDKLGAAKKESEKYHQVLVQRADRMASIGELASGMAHEIRNPLAGIQGAIQILADDFPKEDNRRQITDEIQKQIHKLERLVKDLLNYAKPALPNTLLTDVNELIDKVLSFFMTQRGRSSNFHIQKNFSSPIPKIMIDPNSMEQAFLNIMLNAQKAMPKGGTFTVSTRWIPRGNNGKGEVQILFEDTGVGIPKDNLHRIFNPFFSTRSDGTGLGLSITKNILEQHGGNIAVESHLNQGTTFTITLPVGEETYSF